MATFKQYIYSSDGSAYNKGFEQQQGSIGTLLTSGLQLGVVSHIGIQAPPGTRFYLNHAMDDHLSDLQPADPVCVDQEVPVQARDGGAGQAPAGDRRHL